MSTTQSTITKDMTPVEAANLLVQLEGGQQAAWLSTRELSWQSSEYESRFQNAAEIDGVFRDIMRETIDNGMRHPGEPVDEFAECAEADAWLADARQAGTETTPGQIIQQAEAGITPTRDGDSQGKVAARLLNERATPEDQPYARAFSDATTARARELRGRDPQREPDRTADTPYPGPLPNRGCRVNDHGIYTREPEPQAAPRPEKDLEAGL